MTNCTQSEQLKDSGKRDSFATGAVRDGQIGKGRFDLLPLEALQLVANRYDDEKLMYFSHYDLVELAICSARGYLDGHEMEQLEDCLTYLFRALAEDPAGKFYEGCFEAIQQVAKVFELGAAKYAARNWEKGIPTFRYMDSGLRHAMKHLAGYDDEPHLAQATWNFLCLLQTELWIQDGVLPAELDTLPKPKDSNLSLAI